MAPTLTQVNIATGETAAGEKAFGATYDTDALSAYFSGATNTNDKTDATGTADSSVYEVKVEGETYFVAQDNDTAGAAFSLLKQTATGYEKVQVDGKDVQLANFAGRVTAFVANGANAQAVDLKTGTVGKNLAYNDAPMSVYSDGKNLEVKQVLDKDGNAVAGQYAAKNADGTYLAVNVDTATGNTSVITDTNGKNVEYAVDNTGNAKTIARVGDKVYDATVTGAGTATATATIGTTELAASSLKSLATTNPLEKLDAAIAQVDQFRSSLGAIQNRLNSAVTNLNNTTTNLSSAQSRIQDADYAVEVSNLSKAQIVQQAGNSVLAKANQVPQQVLSLLQG